MKKEVTLRIPSLLTKPADVNVATKPIVEHSPLNNPIIEGLIPVYQKNNVQLVKNPMACKLDTMYNLAANLPLMC